MQAHFEDENKASYLFSVLNGTTRAFVLQNGVNCQAGEKDRTRLPPIPCSVGTVRAGEAIFYPSYTWHETLNGAGISVSMTATAIQPQSAQFVANQQSAACRGEAHYDPPQHATCEDLGACYIWWQQGYGGDFDRALHNAQCTHTQPEMP
jgi:hypothetical protein